MSVDHDLLYLHHSSYNSDFYEQASFFFSFIKKKKTVFEIKEPRVRRELV